MKKINIIFIISIFLVSGCSLQKSGDVLQEQNKEEIVSADLSYKEIIQGKWRLFEDEKSSIEFKENKKIDYYNNEKISEGIFDFYDDYSIAMGKMDERGKYLAVSNDGEYFVYEVVKLTEEELSLIYLSRGNILEYKRNRGE